eukprot:scaffold6807_cov220-Amphora_coffeaeformis.AAC.17
MSERWHEVLVFGHRARPKPNSNPHKSHRAPTSPRTKTLTMTEERSILLINLKPPYELKASTMRMASPGRTSTIQQILIGEKNLIWQDLSFLEYNSAGEDNEDEEPNKVPCTEKAFADAFSTSHTVIIPDSMFVEKSRVFNNTKNFVEHGLAPLKAFYEQGGTVLVQCVEGALSSTCTAQINTLFGTDWKIHVLADTITLGPTKYAQRLFDSPYLPERVVIKDSAFFLSCPEEEGLYKVLLPTREEFCKTFKEQDEVFERLGIERDDSMECFDVDKSWEDYLKKYSDRYGLAIHAQGNGHVIWYGDRSQTNRTMSFVFCKLLNIGTLGTQNDEEDGEPILKKGSDFPSGMILFAILIVFAAVIAKLLRF